MADVRAICSPAASAMSDALAKLRAAGERDLPDALAKVRARWDKVIDKHFESMRKAAVARAKAETERVSRTVLVVELDGMHTFAEANMREHHMQHHKLVGDQRPTVAMACAAFRNSKGVKISLPCTAHLVRIAPNSLDPGDGLPMSLKHVRDGVQDFLGVNDRYDHIVRYTYEQEKRGAQYGVRIEFIAEGAA